MIHIKQFQEISTSDGPKTLLTTQQEQRDFAKIVDNDSLYCLLSHPQGWFVEMIVDDLREADNWWETQKGPARVYYGQTGALRHSK